MLKGIFPMLPTPFDTGGNIIWNDIDKLIESQLLCGPHGLSALGLGGESSALSEHERLAITDRVLKRVEGRVPVIIGVTADDTSLSCRLAEQAARSGAAAVMVGPPVVAEAGTDAHQQHFLVVAEAISPVEVMIQDAPEYLGAKIETEIFKVLSENAKNIRYVKTEAVPVAKSVAGLLSLESFSVFGGNTGLYFWDLLEAGGTGMIPGCEVSAQLVKVYEAYQKGDRLKARKVFHSLLPLFVFEIQTLDFFVACTKEILCQRGIITCSAVRGKSPLCSISKQLLGQHISAIFNEDSQSINASIS